MIRKMALTGIMGAGKSCVGFFINSLGIPFVSADELSQKAVSPPQEGHARLLKILGPSFLKADGSWNRGKIAEKIFHNPDLLSRVEGAIHPLVLKMMWKEAHRAQRDLKPLIVFEVPLLFEKNLQGCFEDSVVVAAKESLCQARLRKHKADLYPGFKNRMSFQLSQEEKLKKADFVLWNNGSLEDLKSKVKALLKKMKILF